MVTINATVHVHTDPERTDRILASLEQLHLRGGVMADELARLIQEVAETKTVMQASAVLIKKLAQQIRDNAGNPAALKALADDLDAQQAELGSAITENTPAEEPPAEEPANP
jgi:hypothetical protein